MKHLFFLLFVLLCVTANCQNKRIIDFNELMETLRAGEKVNVVIDYSLCEWENVEKAGMPTPKAVMGMPIDTWEYFPEGVIRNKKAFVVFSENKLIMNPQGKGFVYNYGKLRINEDNTVQITAKFLSTNHKKELMSQVFKAVINNGSNTGAINLYK